MDVFQTYIEYFDARKLSSSLGLLFRGRTSLIHRYEPSGISAYVLLIKRVSETDITEKNERHNMKGGCIEIAINPK